MIKRALFLFLSSLSCFIAAAQGKLVINELMQSNVDFMMIDHEFPDSWVELYNGSDQTLNIGQYRIGPSEVFSETFQLSASERNLHLRHSRDSTQPHSMYAWRLSYIHANQRNHDR